jgi:hypothetical protein
MRFVRRGADVAFFDPDNGLETTTVPHSRKLSTKHVYWREVRRSWDEGHSVLVYQHHARVTIPDMIDRCRRRAAEVIGEGRVYVLLAGGASSFFLFCREEHADRFELVAGDLCAGDGPRGVLRARLTSDEPFIAHRWTDPSWASVESRPGLVDSDPTGLWRSRSRPPRRSGPFEPLTTRIGSINRNSQEVIRRTDLPGSDHRQRIYVLRCHSCNLEYGANGTDVWLRKCPGCQGGKPGLNFQ